MNAQAHKLVLLEVPPSHPVNAAFRAPDHMDRWDTYHLEMAVALRQALREHDKLGQKVIDLATRCSRGSQSEFVQIILSIFSADYPGVCHQTKEAIAALDRRVIKPLCIGTVEIINSGEWGPVREWVEDMED